MESAPTIAPSLDKVTLFSLIFTQLNLVPQSSPTLSISLTNWLHLTPAATYWPSSWKCHFHLHLWKHFQAAFAAWSFSTRRFGFWLFVSLPRGSVYHYYQVVWRAESLERSDEANSVIIHSDVTDLWLLLSKSHRNQKNQINQITDYKSCKRRNTTANWLPKSIEIIVCIKFDAALWNGVDPI